MQSSINLSDTFLSSSSKSTIPPKVNIRTQLTKSISIDFCKMKESVPQLKAKRFFEVVKRYA